MITTSFQVWCSRKEKDPEVGDVVRELLAHPMFPWDTPLMRSYLMSNAEPPLLRAFDDVECVYERDKRSMLIQYIGGPLCGHTLVVAPDAQLPEQVVVGHSQPAEEKAGVMYKYRLDTGPAKDESRYIYAGTISTVCKKA